MTLIATDVDDDQVVMLGDLLVSSTAPTSKSLHLPSHFDERQRPPSEFVNHLNQKLIIINQHLAVAWSGSKVCAKALIDHVSEHLKIPYSINTGHEIKSLIKTSGLLKHELDQVDLIFVGITQAKDINGNQQFVLYSHNANKRVGKNGEVIFSAGSGGYHFFDQLAFTPIKTTQDKVDSRLEKIASIVGRTAESFIGEIISNDTLDYGYGGGFEIITIPPNSMIFEKQTVSLTIWQKNEDNISLRGPIYSQQYLKDGSLIINRLCIDGITISEWECQMVGNLKIGRPKPETFTPDLNSEWNVHLIVFPKKQPGKTEMLILLEWGAERSMSIERSSDSSRIEIKISNKLMQKVLKIFEQHQPFGSKS